MQPHQYLKSFFELFQKKVEQEYRSSRNWNPNDNKQEFHSLQPLKLPLTVFQQ